MAYLSHSCHMVCDVVGFGSHLRSLNRQVEAGGKLISPWGVDVMGGGVVRGLFSTIKTTHSTNIACDGHDE